MALSWTTGTFTGNQNIDALFWTEPYEGGAPAHWVGTSFTFSFPTDATFYEGSGGYADGGPQDNNFEAFNAIQQQVARTVFAWVESFTPLTFSEVTETADVHADFRFAMTNDASTAYATPPSSETEPGETSEMEGDSWYRNSFGTYDNPTPGTYAFHTILHEIGHNLGLKHGHDPFGGAGALESQYDSNEYSVMTYRNYVGQNINSGYGIPAGHGVQSFMMFDIAALQELYGADFSSEEANASDSVYTFSPTTGTMSINGVAGTAPGANVIFRTIWDGNGTDTYDFSNYTADQQIDLRPGEWSVLDPAQLADLDSFNTHHARGNIANALLYHGDLRSLIENANGGSGADDITGNVGANVLRGFAGDDLLDGGADADNLIGGLGADTVLGDAGDDLLDGDQGIAISAAAPIVKPAGFWNNSIETALRIDGAFNLDANANIQNALTRPHVTIEGTGDGTRDYYAFTVTADGSVGTFDIDGAWPDFDSYLSLFDASGTQIAFSDDSTLDSGSVGVSGTLDSFITHAFASAGTYYIAVGSFPGLAPVPSGDPYTLHVSLDAPSNTLAGGADSLSGGEGNDTLMGSADNDTLDGGMGDDSLIGGEGNDRYMVDAAADVVTEGSAQGTDLIQSSVSIVALAANVEELTLTGSAINGTGNNLANTLTGNNAANALAGLGGNDTIEGGAGDDSLDGGADTDTASYTGAGAVTVNLSIAGAQNTVGAGWDTLTAIENLSGSAFADTLTANTGGNHLAGAGGNDTLAAGTGNDTVDGGAGDDAMNGGADADTVSYASFGTGAVTVNLSIAAAQNTINAGFDTFTGFENLLGSEFGDTLTGNSGANHLAGAGGNDTLEGAAGDDSLDGGADTDTASYASAGAVTVSLAIAGAQNTGGAGFDTLIAIENLSGSASGDTLTGNTGANNLAGAAGNDTLTGGAENDTLTGGAGDDSLGGGTGTDTVSYAGAGAGAGAVTVDLSVVGPQNTVNAGLDTLAGFENVLGSASGDTLTGNSGANQLDGGAGADSMDGGAGDDLYYVDDAGDVAAEAFNDAPAGMDTVQSSVAHTLGFGMDHLVLVSSVGVIGIGNANNNVMIGNEANNTLAGLAGDDTLIGGAGNENLQGGTGADSIHGGDGDDLLQGHAGDDTLRGGIGDDTLRGGADNDTLIGSVGTDIADYFHIGSAITVSMLAGTATSSTDGTDLLLETELVYGSNTFGDLMSAAGTSVGMTFAGWGGNDTLIAGAGNDRLEGGAGVDTVSYAEASAVTINLSLSGSQNTGGAGSDLLNEVENLIGSAFGDTLTGDGGANVLLGAGGNDTLEGAAGDDTLNGGAGIDTASYAGAGAVTVSLAIAGVQNTLGAGSDTLAGIENLSGSASGDTLTGNSGANHLAGAGGNDTLTGSNGNDTLDGGAGADSMNAGDHDDLYIVNAAGDVTFESFNDVLGGVDTVEASATHTLGFGLEHLTLTGSAVINGTGNANNNLIMGNTAVNTLAGLGGNDTMTGGAGNDTLEGGAGDDSLDGGTGTDTVSYAGAGAVTVILSIPGAQNTIGAGLDTLIAIESLLGSAFGDTLVGDTGGNRLDGAGGNDTLYGSDGNDTLNGAAGNDNLQGGSGADSLQGGDNDDFLLGQGGDDAVIGGTGFDTADYFNVAAAMTVSMLAGTAASSTDGTDTLLEIERVYGSNTFGDSMSAADTAIGVGFVGWGGDDTLTGGAGNDTLSGGAGNDTVSYASAGGAVKVDLSITAAQNTMGAGSDTLEQIEYLLGSAFGDTLTGDANGNLVAGAGGNDTLEGAAGDDSLDGGAANDSLSGGAGNDLVDGGTENDHVIGGVGSDTLRGGAGDDLIEGDQGIAISALAPIAKPASFWNDAPGTALWIDGAFNLDANTNIQNALTRSHVTINGVGGGTQDYYAFTVTAGGSFGTFDIDGADPGFDSYLTLLDANGAILASSEDFLTDPGSVGGLATLDSFISHTFASQGTYYIVVGGSPSDSTVVPLGAPYALHVSLDAPSNTLAGGADSLSGGEGNDTLMGSVGNDTLIGGEGNDRYVVDAAADVVTEGAAQGTDLIQSSVSIAALAANVEKLTLTGSATTGTGNNLANTLTGNSAANALAGLGGNDTLNGSGGADTLDGGAGNDSMAGGTGNDRYIVNSALDVVTEAAAGGTADLIQSAVKINALAAEVEKLILTGGDNLNGTGNGLDNTLTGNTGDNVLSGLAGNDTLAGGAGNDTYVVNAAGDVVTEGSGQGSDLIQSSVSIGALAAHVEKLTLTGLALNGTGNNLANTVTGNNAANALAGLGANDTLNGGSGADTLDGGTGKDTLTGGAAKDKFDFTTALNPASNVDVIADFNAAGDTIRLDNDIFTAFVTGNVGLAGSAFYAGVAAHDATDRIIYDTGTGNLYYDADGTGAAAATLFATLTGAPAVTAADFFIVT